MVQMVENISNSTLKIRLIIHELHNCNFYPFVLCRLETDISIIVIVVEGSRKYLLHFGRPGPPSVVIFPSSPSWEDKCPQHSSKFV